VFSLYIIISECWTVFKTHYLVCQYCKKVINVSVSSSVANLSCVVCNNFLILCLKSLFLVYDSGGVFCGEVGFMDSNLGSTNYILKSRVPSRKTVLIEPNHALPLPQTHYPFINVWCFKTEGEVRVLEQTIEWSYTRRDLSSSVSLSQGRCLSVRPSPMPHLSQLRSIPTVIQLWNYNYRSHM
jgi:hypothetical protein